MQPVLLNMSYHVMSRIILGFLDPSEYAVESDKPKANGNINGFAWLSFLFAKLRYFLLSPNDLHVFSVTIFIKVGWR